MSTLSIIEGQGVGKQASSDQQAMTLPVVAGQAVTFSGTPGYSAATNANTSLVRLYADATCTVLASTTSSASVASGTVTGIPLVSSTIEYFSVPTGGGIYFSVVAKG